ncbi:MAG: PKD domain-containing protein, partial [Schleiferiaceae bacterium]|nr:PKD domain-containing protein [Schleiferiaceae bacterium]
AWVGPFTFCTLCSPFTAPFIESFNNPGAEPQCWGNYNATGATGLNDIWKNTSVNWPAYGASGVTDNTGNGGYAMGVDGSSSSAKGVRLETPLIDVSALTSPELRFHIFSNNTTNPGDNNPMYIDFFDGSNWNDSIYTYAADSASWVEVIISLSGYTITGPVQFRFNLDKNANPAFYNDVLIDDVIVDNALTCVKPTGVNVSNIGQTSATVNWTTGGATNWQVNYGPSGTAAGAGTWVNVTGGSATLSLTGLMSCSGYDVYVRDSCGPGDVSFWTTVTNFSTLASVQPLPFLENFNNSLSCWTVTSNGSSATETWKHMPTYNGNTLDGTGFGFVDSDAAGSGGVTLDEELTSPPIDASGLGPNDTLWLEFDQYYNNLGDTCYVDVWDGTQWVNVLTQYTSAGGWSSPDHQMIDITMYANANLQVRFHYKDFGIWAWYWAVDNINVHASSSTGCVAPANLAVNNVTCSEADLSWNSDGGTIITFVRWDTAGFNPATGGNLIINPTSPHTITGLMPGYTYDVWVADSCPLGVAASMLQFTTPTAPMPTIGYTANQMTTTANNATWHFDATSSQNGDTYTWDFGGGNMVNGDTASFTYGQNGAYQVTLTITNGCGSVDSTFTVNVQGISIAESALGRSLKVFPNPNNGDFNVSFLLDANEQVDIRVLNPAGQIILSENLGNIDQYDGNINLSHAAKGMYILQIETSQGVINRRVTIQ